jgi:hypothetical protein
LKRFLFLLLLLHLSVLVFLSSTRHFDFNDVDEPLYFGVGSIIWHRNEVANLMTLYHPPLSFYLNSLLLGANPIDWSKATNWFEEVRRPGERTKLRLKEYQRPIVSLVLDSIGWDLVWQTRAAGRSVPWLFLRGRIAFILLSVGLAFFLFRMLHRLSLPIALGVTAVYCLSPLVLSTVPGIMTDFTMTALASMAVVLIARWSDRAEIGLAVAAGAFSGLALGSKLSALLLVPIWIVAAGRALFQSHRTRVRPAKVLWGLAASALSAFLVLWMIYGFQVDSLKNVEQKHHTYILHELDGRTPPISALEEKFPNLYRSSLPIPSYVTSIRWLRLMMTGRFTIAVEGPLASIKDGPSYFGAVVTTYFPLGFLLLLLASTWLVVRKWRPRFIESSWWIVALWPILYAIFAFRSSVLLGSRYLFPLYPLTLLGAGVVSAKLASCVTVGLTILEAALYLLLKTPWSLWVYMGDS